MITKRQRETLASVRASIETLSRLDDQALRRYADDLRVEVMRPDRQNVRPEHRVEAIAIANEAVRRVLGWSLYDVQLLAALAMTDSTIAEMQTGEGKTVSAVPTAVWGGILGQGVHVATPNTYLAERDFEQLRPVYELIGLRVGLVGCEDECSPQAAYACDITYGPGYEFGFDYLRDQRILKSQQQQPRGARTMAAFLGNSNSELSHRGLGMVLVDEADHVLIDDAVSPQVLSEYQAGEAPDGEIVLLAKVVAASLETPLHYFETPARSIKLTEEGINLIHNTGLNVAVDLLKRPWSSYVEAAIQAKVNFDCDVDYVVRDDKVKIVEQSTGRIFDDRSWQSGLHQAIEAKENLPITPESIPLAQITRQRFFRLYQHLSGMTGTIGNCKREFQSIYGLSVVPIPLRQPSQRQILPLRLFQSQLTKWDAIVESIRQFHQRQRPVLVGTRTIRDSALLAARLDSQSIQYDLLNGIQDAGEADIVARAGRRGAITIATNLAGRGTDIKLSDDVRSLGGLHVIVSECFDSYRADRQLIGRCGRQGDPGSCQTFVAADDWLFLQHAPWITSSLQTEFSKGASRGELDYPIEPQIRGLQKRLELERFAVRQQMLEQVTKRNQMLLRTRKGVSP